MQTDEFEQAFSCFLESADYDDAADALFTSIRTAFLAGWKAARGEAPELQDKVIYLLHKPPTDHV